MVVIASEHCQIVHSYTNNYAKEMVREKMEGFGAQRRKTEGLVHNGARQSGPTGLDPLL